MTVPLPRSVSLIHEGAITLTLPRDIDIGRHRILIGDVRERLRELPDASVHCCVTSPPYYGLRDYGVPGQLGLEPTLAEYLAALVDVFREVRRVLRPDGTVWINIGDSYAQSGSGRRHDNSEHDGGSGFNPSFRAGRYSHGAEIKASTAGLKPKDLMMVPARLAIALQDDGWYLRSDIIWHKKAPMPESVQGSQYVRHQVTIAEYERLSGLRYSPERHESNGIGNLSGVSACPETGAEAGVQQDGEGAGTEPPLSPERQVPGGETPLHAEREGQGDGAGEGRTRGRAGEASPVQPITAGSSQQGEVRSDGEWAGDQGEGDSEVSQQRARQAETSGVRPAGSESPASHCGQEKSEREVRPVRENEGQEATGLRSASRGHRASSPAHSERLDRDSGAQQPQVLLLWGADDANDGSRDSGQQGRAARERERGPSLPDLQLQEERQDNDALLVDCPGCDKCRDTDGWILRWNAGRPTSAHEHVFLLAKRPRYYYDADAVREEPTGINGGGWSRAYAEAQPSHGAMRLDRPNTGVGANLRNVWTLGPEPFPDAHFATFPTGIPRRAIKAGTSERGVCAACGAPWVRQTEVAYKKNRPSAGNDPRSRNEDRLSEAREIFGSSGWQGNNLRRETTTTGWAASCACDADVIPATCLDPFLGSGTTMLVADQLGRACVGIELNETYARMAERRVRSDAPLLVGVA